MSGSVRIETASWDCEAERRAMTSVRETVFVVEQGVPLELELDGLDPTCHHVVALDGAGRSVGTARMQPCGHIGRIAVLRPWRRQSVGSRLLAELLEVARRAGLESVELDSQVHAIGFYEKHGFQPRGDIFLDAGLEHRNMVARLRP